jgi:hypothetical protein
MEITEYLKNFLATDTPFMLMFVTLFFYFIKTARDREKEKNNIMEKRLVAIQNDIHVLIKVWKILLEKELEARRK